MARRRKTRGPCEPSHPAHANRQMEQPVHDYGQRHAWETRQIRICSVQDDVLGERSPLREAWLLSRTDLSVPGPTPLAATAAAAERDRHPIPDSPSADLFTELDHHAGKLVTRHYTTRCSSVAVDAAPRPSYSLALSAFLQVSNAAPPAHRGARRFPGARVLWWSPARGGVRLVVFVAVDPESSVVPVSL